MQTDPKLAMARRAAASVRPYSHNSALILDGERDGTDVVRAAIAAIEECTEAHAQIADNWNPGRKDRVTETSIAEAIRDHLKGPTDA